MKFIIKLIVMLLFISIAGCDEDVKPIKTLDVAAVKARSEPSKANQIVQDAVLRQQKKIEEITR
ncbi:MAG: hypothetical protein ACXWTK_00930 [Methylobacter sp.]